MLDLAYYTTALGGQLGTIVDGNSQAFPDGGAARAWELGGLRGSVPLTRVYPGVASELWNLNGISHKIVASVNAAFAHSNQPYTRFPQLDRLNDWATDQSLRDIRPLEALLNPGAGQLLATSPLYDPQTYAIRRLVLSRIDTLSSIEVVQLDLRQRLQTKRGYPGLQHIVDWMVLDLSASYFPRANTDNFGSHWAFLQYNYLWNIGDRTALTSTGWVDPEANGPRVWTVGGYFNRPDRTNFYLGYRQIDPLQSKAVTASVTYVFSPKYAITANSTYDFGTNASLSNSLVLTRMGSDLQLSAGISYNATVNTFGVSVEIIPNVANATQRIGGMPAFGSGLLGR
jgi:hypothetical protein